MGALKVKHVSNPSWKQHGIRAAAMIVGAGSVAAAAYGDLGRAGDGQQET